MVERESLVVTMRKRLRKIIEALWQPTVSVLIPN